MPATPMQTALVSFPAPLCRRESTQKALFPSLPDLFPRKRGIMLSIDLCRALQSDC
jgi:hypothetical protein